VANADGVDPRRRAHLEARAGDRLDAATDLALVMLEAYQPVGMRRSSDPNALVVHDARDPLRCFGLAA
jgi:hypothetical protein